MSTKPHSRLLTLDSLINLALGAALLFAPRPTIALLGLPPAEGLFYVTLLGAILFGIGLALWIERRGSTRWRGLGLAGAIVINLLGAGTVAAWLIIAPWELPLRGTIVLWGVVVVVLGTALAELITLARRTS